jgi:hypothetical protein
MAKLRTSKLPVPKPVSFPKAKTAKVVLPKILSTEAALKQFATKPVVPAPNTKGMTKKLKSYL